MLSAISSAAGSFAESLAVKIQKVFMYAGIIVPVFLIIATIFTLTNNERGCVEAYQFDSENTFIDSKPTADGIFGGPYNDTSGGENAAWHPTGLRTDGGRLTFEIRGAWTAWDEANTQSELERLPACNICAKKSGVDNCICKIGEISKPEKNSLGQTLTNVDCSVGSIDQENPASCTCTNSHGTINDFGTYFIATDYQDKSEALRFPDDQNPCKYTGGLGLYIGLFGQNGNTVPIRVYQIYPTQEVCDISRNSQGKCVDDFGNDQTKYIYESPNGKNFIKDDKAGNNGTDTDPADDEYHKSGEFIKFIINDRYYRDNFGGYDINLEGGFIRPDDSGLLEYIVSNVEDILLGKIKYNTELGINIREGGILEFLYNSIVKDSAFILIVQMCLIMYVMLFGIWVLSGNLQISNKEMMKRIIKIALVIFFTTETSWYFYNQLVVGIFKDGMDAVIAIFMNGSDKALDQTSLIITSQLDRANSVSYSTRFSYVDEVIKKLLSTFTSRKIWSLFFGEWFGMLYIPVIYGLIFAFVYIMLTAAFVYICALLRLIFVLSLGPIFMVTVLFGRTDEMFKRWLSFMASQSIQMICLFLVLYLFVALIYVNFNDLLYYRACTNTVNFGLFNINFLKSETNRGLTEWIIMFAKIATLLFLLKMIMEKIPGFAGHLVSINSQAADTSATFVSNTNNSAFGLAKGIMGKAFNAASDAVTKGLPSAISIGLSAARVTGLSKIGNSIRKKIPFRSPASLYRDHKIDSIIAAKQKEGKKEGLTGKDLDKYVREKTFEEINKLTSTVGKDAAGKAAARSAANTLNIFGVDNEAINKRLNQKLVAEPLKKAIKDATDEIKKESKEKGTEMPLTKAELDKAVRAKIETWATDNSSVDKSQFLKLLDQKQYSSLVKKHGELTSDEAAKMYANNEKEKNRYLQHLQDRQFEKERKKGVRNKIKDLGRGIQGKAAYNPKQARMDFLRKAQYEEAKLNNKEKYGLGKKALDRMGINPEKISINQRIGALDKFGKKQELAEISRKAETEAMAAYLKDGYQKEEAAIKEKYKKAIDKLDVNSKGDQSDLMEAKIIMDKEMALANEKQSNYMAKLGEQHNELKLAAEQAELNLKKFSQDDQGNAKVTANLTPLEQEVEKTKEAFKYSQDILNELAESDHNKKVESQAAADAKAAAEAKAAEDARLAKTSSQVLEEVAAGEAKYEAEKAAAEAAENAKKPKTPEQIVAEVAAAEAKAEADKALKEKQAAEELLVPKITPEQKTEAEIAKEKAALDEKAAQPKDPKSAAEEAADSKKAEAAGAAGGEVNLINQKSAILNKLKSKADLKSRISTLEDKAKHGKISEAEKKALANLQAEDAALGSEGELESALAATNAKLEPK